MATKKEKRVRNLAQREAFFEQVRLDGLKSLKKAHIRRERETLQQWEKTHTEKHHSFVDNCPHCILAKRKQVSSG